MRTVRGTCFVRVAMTRHSFGFVRKMKMEGDRTVPRAMMVERPQTCFIVKVILGLVLLVPGTSPAQSELAESKPGGSAVVFNLGELQVSRPEDTDLDEDEEITQRLVRFLEADDLPGEIYPVAARMLQEQPDIEPNLEQAPTTPAARQLSSIFSVSQASIVNQLSAARRSQGAAPGSDFVLGIESSILATTDAGNLISKSNAILGVGTEQRTPIVTYNVTRGRHVGQQSGNGSYWFPARQDLDTLMSKIDSRLVDNFLVTMGPYSSLYGPGYAFYDIELQKAPRYHGGQQSHGRTSVDWKENGDQWYGRQTFLAGSTNWGIRIGHGERSGNDYQTGDSLSMPTSYNSSDWDMALGWDLSPYQRLDFTLLRLDQTDVEFPGQMFDIRFLVTDAYSLEYVNDCPEFSDRIEAEGWYNRTRFAGDNLAMGKRRQIPALDGTLLIPLAPPPVPPLAVDTALNGFTDVDAMSTGYSTSATWECSDCGHFKLGSDLRFLKQNLNEVTQLDLNPPLFPSVPSLNSIPHTHSVNPGLFVERELCLNPCLSLRAGGRLDIVSTNSDPTNNRFIEDAVGDDLSRDFFLYSAYITAERKIGSHLKVDFGGGYGMRPPTMTELYADNPFIAVLPQLVVTRVVGNPNLDASRMWQVDLGITVDCQRFRGGARGYHSWVADYITYDFVNIPLVGDTFNTVNTPLATLVGGEAYLEYDINRCWTGFGTLSYVAGTDRTRDNSIGIIRQDLDPTSQRSGSALSNEALPVINPLQSRVGMRWHDPSANPRWAVEFAGSIVDDQDRFAATLIESKTPGYAIYDIRAYRQLTDKLLVTIGVENLFDRFYQTHFDPRVNPGANLGVFQPGATFYTGFDLTY